MLIKETYTNETKGHIIGDSGPYEPWTENVGQLFRAMQKEYGACKSAVYVDRKDGDPVRTGWYFEKRTEYEDARESWPKDRRFYVRGVWVAFVEPRKVTRETEVYADVPIPS